MAPPHGRGVYCTFCGSWWMVSHHDLIVCKNWYKHNLKVGLRRLCTAMYLKTSAMTEFFNPKVGLRALFSGPHWLAPYHICMRQGVINTWFGSCSILLVPHAGWLGSLSSILGSLKRAAALLTAIWDSQLSQAWRSCWRRFVEEDLWSSLNSSLDLGHIFSRCSSFKGWRNKGSSSQFSLPASPDTSQKLWEHKYYKRVQY